MRRKNFGSPKRAAAASLTPVGQMTGAKAGGAEPVTKRAKYNAQGRYVGDLWCASEAEAIRYEQLVDMVSRGLVSKLETQVSFIITVNNVRIGVYRADFRYRWHGPEVADPRGILIVEEVKGLETPEWKLKCKLVEALYGFKISVIKKLSGKDWLDHPELATELIGRKSSFAEQIKVRYADRIVS